MLRKEIQLVTGVHYPPLLARGVREQWSALRRFLQRCTDAAIPPRDASLHLNIESSLSRRYAKRLRQAQQLFGRPGDVTTERGLTKYQWELRPRQFLKAIEFMESGEPWPRRLFEPVSLNFISFFRLRDPRTGKVLPRQARPPRAYDGRPATQFYFSLGPDGHATGDLRLPFSDVTPALLTFLAALENDLPFRLPTHRLRHAIPTKAGHTFRHHRLTTAELALIRSHLSPGAVGT